MKLKYILLISLAAIFIYILGTHLKCTNFNGNFHHSFVVNSFHLNELVATETGVPILVARIFHNKITTFIFDLFNRYVQFFDISYLIKILGVVGLFGLIYFYFQIFARIIRNTYANIFAILLVLLPFLEIYQFIKYPFFLKLIIFVLPYQIASFIGYLLFMKQRKNIAYAIYFILLMLSIGWIIVFQNELLSFCTTG
jgi:hypothetical protein